MIYKYNNNLIDNCSNIFPTIYCIIKVTSYSQYEEHIIKYTQAWRIYLLAFGGYVVIILSNERITNFKCCEFAI